jgi:hypothetical protein
MSAGTAMAVAVAAGSLYFLGFTLFKSAAATMPPLRGTRPLHFAGTVLSSAGWLSGALVMGIGVVLQLAALERLSLPVLVSGLLCGLIVLVLIAAFVSQERVTAPELCCLALMAVASLLIAWSGPGAPSAVPIPLLLLLGAPSIVLPVLVFSLNDIRPEGQHARPLTGLAYGISAGVLIGLAELALSLQSGPIPDAGPAAVFLLAVACGIAQLQIALQRCRMIIVVFVATIVAKAYLAVVSGLLALGLDGTAFTTPWLLPPGLTLLAAAALLFPRHES